MSTSDNYKDGASKSSDDGVCEMNDMLQNMSTADAKESDISICANCGKKGSDVNNTCNKCKHVMYCNAACKKKHRHKHKKECEEHLRLAAERAAKLHDIELFKQPPPSADCPICFLRLPCLGTGSVYYVCCGKMICSGCGYAPVYDNQRNEIDSDKCPFCRTQFPIPDEEMIERQKKRIELDDPIAMFSVGCDYRDGTNVTPQDYSKALALFHRAGELGHAGAYAGIGNFYYNGEGVEVDKKKAEHYHELAAMGGNESARCILGIREEVAGNIEKALKHFMIAVKCGHIRSLNQIKDLYSDGDVTKDDYTKALQLYQVYLGEIKSKQRDEAAACSEDCRYF